MSAQALTNTVMAIGSQPCHDVSRRRMRSESTAVAMSRQQIDSCGDINR
jgi:hypothetical protein